MVTLRDCLGEERWAQVQRSPLHDAIRNCNLEEVTIGELIQLAILFDVTIQVMVEEIYSAVILESGE